MVKDQRLLLIYFNRVSTFLLVLVWVYAAVSKLTNFDLFKRQMQLQVFYPFIKSSLIYLLPPVELLIAALLIFPKTQIKGYQISLLLFLAFTIYVGLAAFHFLPDRPCSCGGILTHIGWIGHFWFNLFFLALISVNIILFKEGKISDKE